MTNKQTIEEAKKRYAKWGASAVYDFASHIEWRDWGVCEQCDETTPTIDEVCMVCGTFKRKAIKCGN